MGTNFYCRHIPTKEEHKKLEDYLNSKQYKELKENLLELTQPYHIGKRSFGWQFHFQANDHKVNSGRFSCFEAEALVPWEATLESLTDYLKREDVEIYNEYGDVFTFDEFWNNEIGNYLYMDENHTNSEQYYKETGEQRNFHHNTEFESDGLRFDTEWFC